eukprot:525022_1
MTFFMSANFTSNLQVKSFSSLVVMADDTKLSSKLCFVVLLLIGISCIAETVQPMLAFLGYTANHLKEMILMTRINDNYYFNTTNTIIHNITFVTGASQNHFYSLIQFINSFNKYVTAYNKYDLDSMIIIHSKLIIYDLGIHKTQFKVLKKGFPNHTFEKFDYNIYSSFINIKKHKGQYAWKPIIIYNICQKYGDFVVWMDSGDLIENSTFIPTIFNVLRNNSIYSRTTNGDIKKWVYYKTISYLNYTDSLSNKMRDGSLMGFNYNINWIKQFVTDFRNCALIKQCIAPNGSSRRNHRQDQAVFTILYYQYHKKHTFQMLETLLYSSRHNDIDKHHWSINNDMQLSLDHSFGSKSHQMSQEFFCVLLICLFINI